MLGVVASVAGLLGGLGFSKALGGLFDAAGMGIPRGAMELAPRTIVIALAVGIGVTAAAAMLPAVRATRVPPVAACARRSPPSRHRPSRKPAGRGRARRRSSASRSSCRACSAAGAASSRLAAMGLRLAARVRRGRDDRALRRAIRWPRSSAGRSSASAHATGELARENSTRNPARTAITAAALMVGIALVVFVAVLADGMKTSFTGAIDAARERRPRRDERQRDAAAGVPRGTASSSLPEVSTAAAQYLDQVKVNGQGVHALTDQVNGVEPLALRDVYRFRWIRGSDIELQRLGPGAAIVEEQFAKQHRISVGDGASVSPGRPATRRRSPRSPSTATRSCSRA